MHKVYLLTGGNIGNRVQNLAEASQLLNQSAGTIIQESALFETAAWGITDQGAFLNQALEIDTVHEPHTLLRIILQIERQMGRVRYEKNGPRIIDIDILFFADMIISDEKLTIPHPLLSERRFALVPMNDIAPDFVHPLSGLIINTLLLQCPDLLAVNRYPPVT
jgi:2-amino-4-hydroxy-6-hydroxymethyldihydropteridine diphosphokinase